jgi:hypothetical protein
MSTFLNPNAILDGSIAPEKMMEGEYLNMTSGFSHELTGRIEVTPEEFTFRPSAGDNKSIRDESAVMRRIKGNTTVWGQLADITKVSNTGAKYIMETGDGWFSIQRDLNKTETPYCFINMEMEYGIPHHKYLLCQEIEVSGIETSDDYCSAAAYNFTPSSIVDYKQNGRYIWSKILTKSDNDTFQFFYYAYGNAKLKVSNLQCFDLTSIFGAGNEPTTYEEFRAIYPDIYPYCEPEIRNVKTTAIETIGFNQWDEQWEKGSFDSETGVNVDYSDNIRCKNPIKVLPNTVYSVYVGDSRSYVFAMFFDNNGNVLTPIIYSEDSWINEKRLCISSNVQYNAFITPEGASWMKFFLHADYGSTYTNDVSISLFHSGIRRGEYEPYKKNTLLLPEINKYFFNGMNGIGDVCDEINSENAIQRIGFVDIGELEWYTGDQKHMFLAPIENAKPTIWNEVANAIMLPYTAVSRIEADTADMSFCVNNIYHVPDRVCLTNYNYEDAASFKAAMSGVYLYYELAEPEIRPISEPIQLVYDVEDFGTERAVSSLPSAPFRADIVYQFNAEGRIRDNSRNIEKLANKKLPGLNFIYEETETMDGYNGSFEVNIKMPRTTKKLEVLYNTLINQSCSLEPNIYYIYNFSSETLMGAGSTTTFLLSPFGTYGSNGLNEYMVEFTMPNVTGDSFVSPTIGFLADIKWTDGVTPYWEPGYTYQVSITNSGVESSVLLGSYLKFK